MIKILVSYEKGNYCECQDVEKIVYNTIVGDQISVEGDDLLNHHFPVGRTLWVHSKDGTTSISGSGIRSIDVYRE